MNIIGENENDLNKTLINLKESAKKIGLNLNQNKTEYLKVSRKSAIHPPTINLADMTFRNSNHFKYLGSVITKDNNIKAEINMRIQAGNRAYFALQQLLSSKILSYTMKANIYWTLIRPVILYGAETWSITKAKEDQLQRFENKIL